MRRRQKAKAASAEELGRGAGEEGLAEGQSVSQRACFEAVKGREQQFTGAGSSAANKDHGDLGGECVHSLELKSHK